MDIWKIKHRSMRLARLCAANAVLLTGLLLWGFAISAYFCVVLNGISLIVTGWAGIKYYRIAVARI